MIVFVAAAAFGAKLWHRPPTDFVLPPAVDDGMDGSAAAARAEPDAITGTSGRFGSVVAGVPPRADDRLIGTASGSADATPGRIKRDTAPINRWAPWGTGSGRRNANDSGFSSGSASLGGLWHTMSSFGHGGTTAETAVVARNDPGVKLATKPSTAKPAPSPSSPSTKPAPGPSAPSSTPSAGGSSAGGDGDPAAPGTGLGEDAPPSDPGGPAPPGDPTPPGGGGGIPPGGGGGGSTGGGDLSANPEPGTIALFGTGLVGLIGVLRRRRH